MDWKAALPIKTLSMKTMINKYMPLAQPLSNCLTW